MQADFETELSGGHPNSLGGTVAVVDKVLQTPALIAPLFATYRSEDPVVRLRVSNAMKRLSRARPELVLPYIDRFLDEVALIDQPSAQWTLAQVFGALAPSLSRGQRMRAQSVLQDNLVRHDDWIVLTQTMQTLAAWASEDDALRAWLGPELARLARDPRKSVSKKAAKLRAQLSLP